MQYEFPVVKYFCPKCGIELPDDDDNKCSCGTLVLSPKTIRNLGEFVLGYQQKIYKNSLERIFNRAP